MTLGCGVQEGTGRGRGLVPGSRRRGAQPQVRRTGGAAARDHEPRDELQQRGLPFQGRPPVVVRPCFAAPLDFAALECPSDALGGGG